jgi:NTP pyrophosphatase (non-canonical NTP hydrolase)
MKFADLEQANRLRLPQFKNRKGQPAHTEANGHDWSIAEWTNAMAGEAGEACNIAKKIIRGDYEGDEELGVRLLLEEIADVVIYADLCCQRVGGNMEHAVWQKFNEVSLRVGSDVVLSK